MRRPSFGSAAERTARFCGAHRRPGDVDLRNRPCQYVYGCRIRPTFGEPRGAGNATGRPIFCAAHRQASGARAAHRAARTLRCRVRESIKALLVPPQWGEGARAARVPAGGRGRKGDVHRCCQGDVRDAIKGTCAGVARGAGHAALRRRRRLRRPPPAVPPARVLRPRRVRPARLLLPAPGRRPRRPAPSPCHPAPRARWCGRAGRGDGAVGAGGAWRGTGRGRRECGAQAGWCGAGLSGARGGGYSGTERGTEGRWGD